MLWTIAVVLVVLWLLGFRFKIGGNLVHALIVIAAVVLLVQLLS